MSVYSTKAKNKLELQKQLDLLGETLQEHCETASRFESTDPRALSLARTNLQMGFMWFRRALENPDRF